MILLAVLLFGCGHLLRDGWPPLGSTHAARGLGALLCGLGGYAGTGSALTGMLAFLGIGIGFYTDMEHGEGQDPSVPGAGRHLLISGLTSLLPLALLGLPLQHMVSLAIWIGFLKPMIWRAAWAVRLTNYPTRLAAWVFGAGIGGAVTLLAGGW